MKQHSGKEKAAKHGGLPKLRLVRQRQGLSLGQLADLSGFRRDTITNLEAGRISPQPYHLRILAHVLGVASHALVG